MKKKLEIAALVPLKLNSRRLPNKNFLRLGDRPLAYHIFDTLSQVEGLDETYCFTSQSQIMDLLPEGLNLLIRPARLDGDEIKANELFFHAISNIDAEWIVLCHATAPFLSKESIEEGIRAVLSGEYDCAFSVKRHQTYCWYDGQPLNYDTKNMTQTQGLKPVYSESSGFYIFRKDDYIKSNTRIGSKPCLVEINDREAIDIDEPEDFNFATHMLSYQPEKLTYSTDNFFVRQANRKNPHKNIRHVSFDLDGVLIDSLPLMEASWAKAMDASGLSIAFELYKQRIGIPFDGILAELKVPQDKLDLVTKVYDEHSRANIDQVQVYPNAIASVERLCKAGLQVSIVTSKSKRRTTEIVSKLFKTLSFDCIISPEDVLSGRGKPHPDPLLLACVTLGVDPQDTIFVGDMKADYLATMAAGIHFVHANWGYGELTKVKGVWFNKIEDLTSYLLED